MEPTIVLMMMASNVCAGLVRDHSLTYDEAAEKSVAYAIAIKRRIAAMASSSEWGDEFEALAIKVPNALREFPDPQPGKVYDDTPEKSERPE